MRSKGYDPTNIINPGSFKMEIAINSTGGPVDISDIVTEVRVYESIFQNALIAEIDIADGVNLLENYNLTGNEIIVTKLEVKGYTGEDGLRHMWYVLDMPLFGRPKPDVQVYTIRCVSPFGVASKVLRTEATYKGSLIEILAKMYRELGISNETNLTRFNDSLHITDNAAQSIGVNKFIPARMTYHEAMELILSKTMNPEGAPAFAFETFNGFHRIESYRDFSERARSESGYYSKYYNGSFYSHPDQTEDSYEEKRQRILSISSDLGFSPYKGMTRGAYVTRIHQVDWGIKSYVVKDFNAMYEKNKLPIMDNDLVLHPNFQFGLYDYSNLVDTHNIYLAKNTLGSIDNQEFNIHENTGYLMGNRKALIENMEQINHTVKLYGDPLLRPGEVIQIVLPKINMQFTGEFASDELLSGNYFIASTTHRFNSTGYLVDVKLKKDSVDRGGLAPKPKNGELSPTDEGLGISADGDITSPVPKNVSGTFTSKNLPAGTITGLNESQTAAYLNALSKLESGGDYSVTNQFNYLGKYQMGNLALIDLGYVKAGTSLSGMRNPANWTGKGGITSQEDFLSTPSVQESAIVSYTNLNRTYITSTGIDLTDYSVSAQAGILASSHLVGAGGTSTWLKSDGQTTSVDGNGVVNTKYYNTVGGAVAYVDGEAV